MAAEARESGFFEVGRLGIAKGAFRASATDLLRGIDGWFVYFLFRDDACVYVGKTHRFAYRMRWHAKSKKVDNVYAIVVPEMLVPCVEAYWIRRLQPALNIAMLGQPKPPPVPGRGRGRPPKPPGEKQTARLELRLTPDEKAIVESAAGGEPVAVWAARVLLRAAKRRRA